MVSNIASLSFSNNEDFTVQLKKEGKKIFTIAVHRQPYFIYLPPPNYVRMCGTNSKDVHNYQSHLPMFEWFGPSALSGMWQPQPVPDQDLNLFQMISYTTRMKLFDDSSSGNCRSFAIRA